MLVIVSHWRNEIQAAVGGVPIFMNRKAKSYVRKELFKKNFSSNTNLTAYSATNVRSIDETVSFYRNLADSIDPQLEFIIPQPSDAPS